MKHYVLLIVGILALPLSGCMMWTHGNDHGSSHQMPERAKTIEKEIPEADARLSLAVPLISAGDEATLILTTSRIQDGTPITGAKVVFLVERMQQPGAEHAEHHITAVAEREAEETAGKGVYQSRHRFEGPGLYRITGRVWIGSKEAAAAPLAISITQEVGQREGHETDKSTTSMVVIGGIGMAVMMLIMVL
jgi:hypothetical protein